MHLCRRTHVSFYSVSVKSKGHSIYVYISFDHCYCCWLFPWRSDLIYALRNFVWLSCLLLLRLTMPCLVRTGLTGPAWVGDHVEHANMLCVLCIVDRGFGWTVDLTIRMFVSMRICWHQIVMHVTKHSVRTFFAAFVFYTRSSPPDLCCLNFDGLPNWPTYQLTRMLLVHISSLINL